MGEVFQDLAAAEPSRRDLERRVDVLREIAPAADEGLGARDRHARKRIPE